MVATVYVFAGHRLDAARRSLTRDNGVALKLTGKPFDALVYLVEQRGRVVDRAALVQAVWPKRVVEDNNLNQAIAAIRRAIGDEHVVTVPGRGYQFVTPVSGGAGAGEVSVALAAGRADGNAVARARREWSRWPIVTAAALVGLVALGAWGLRDFTLPQKSRPSIAVLPLENLTPDPAKAYIAVGFHEAIVGRLFALDFDVRPRGEVVQYSRSPRPPLTEIARALGVDAVMEGTVRYTEDRLRISLTLVPAEGGEPLWNDTFDRDYADLFAVESEVARNVADALHVALTPQQLAAADEGYTQNPVAYDLYQTAMDFERRGIWNSDFAASQYQRAVELDPEFAVAWARLAMTKLALRRWIRRGDPELLPAARAAADRAVAIAPGLVLGQLALAYHAYLEGGDRTAILSALNAVQAKSRRIPEFFVIRANAYQDLGRWEEALEDRSQVVALEPRNVPFLLGNAEAYAFLRRYDEAQGLADRARELEPNDPGMLFHRAGLALYRGDSSEFRALEPRVLAGELPLNGGSLRAALYMRDYDALTRLATMTSDPLNLAGAHFFAGRSEEARPLFATARGRLEAALASAPPALHVPLEIALGQALAGLGERDAAIEHAQAALAELDVMAPAEATAFRVEVILLLAMAGASQRAVEELDAYLATGYGFWSLEGLLPHPALDAIRTDSRFVELVAKYRMPGPVMATAAAPPGLLRPTGENQP